jgi:hypothetical protein
MRPVITGMITTAAAWLRGRRIEDLRDLAPFAFARSASAVNPLDASADSSRARDRVDLGSSRATLNGVADRLPHEIAQALRDFVEAALQAMRATGRTPVTVVSPWVRQWRRSGNPAFFMPEPMPRLELPLRLAGTDGPLQQLRDYARARELFLRDPWLTNYVGGLVGTASHRVRVDFDMLLDEHLLIPVVQEVGELRFDERAFVLVLNQFAAELLRPDLTSLSVVPISGLTFDTPIELGDGIIVRKLEEAELSELLDLGVLPDQSDRFGRYLAESDQSALCLVEREALVIEDQSDVVPAHRNLATPADDFCMAVRLIIGGAIDRGPYIYLAHGLFGQSTGASYEQRRRPSAVGAMPAVIRDDRDRVQITELYARLRGLDNQIPPSLSIALQRFRDARLRPDDTDVLLDLMIAAEALLVGSEGSITTRIALGAAVWCELPDVPRSAVRRFMTRAYRARSRLVHGQALQPEVLRDLHDEPCDRSVLIDDVEGVVRAGLVRAVETGASFRSSSSWEPLLAAQLDADA